MSYEVLFSLPVKTRMNAEPDICYTIGKITAEILQNEVVIRLVPARALEDGVMHLAQAAVFVRESAEATSTIPAMKWSEDEAAWPEARQPRPITANA